MSVQRTANAQIGDNGGESTRKGQHTANSPERGRTVISRAVAILGAFTPRRPRLTLAQICRETGLPHATAHRIVAELVGAGALERTASGYVIGLRLWEMGSLNPRGLPLRARAMPVMEDLHAATGQHVQLAVLDGEQAVVVERISTPDAVPVVSQVGGRLPLHASAVGKMLLAHAGEELLRAVERSGLPRYTPTTIVDPRRLRAHLAECRTTGVAIVREEMSPGAFSVAAAITDSRGRVVAALSVVGADPATQRLAPAVVLAGRGISRNLRAG